MAEKHYYLIAKGFKPGEYRVSKCDSDLEILQSYKVKPSAGKWESCDCPSRKRPCKHVLMVEKFRADPELLANKVYNPITQSFVDFSDL